MANGGGKNHPERGKHHCTGWTLDYLRVKKPSRVPIVAGNMAAFVSLLLTVSTMLHVPVLTSP